MNDFVPFLEEGLFREAMNSKIQEIFQLLSNALKTQHPTVSLPAEKWLYVILPRRLENPMRQEVAACAHCLTRDKTIVAIVLKPTPDFFPLIGKVLSLENDTVYFLAFAATEADDAQLLDWTTRAMDDGRQDALPPHSLLALDGGALLQG